MVVRVPTAAAKHKRRCRAQVLKDAVELLMKLD